jgi:4-alpha-glucanotransferase
LSYRLLWFEQDDPSLWPRKAMAAITTHDLPTVAGLWTGTDIETQRRVGLDPDDDSINAIRDRLAEATGLPTDASATEAVVAAHRLLARAPAVMLAATLDDAVAEPERPNMPGADDYRANWCLALRIPIEEIQTDALVLHIAEVLDASQRESSPSSIAE